LSPLTDTLTALSLRLRSSIGVAHTGVGSPVDMILRARQPYHSRGTGSCWESKRGVELPGFVRNIVSGWTIVIAEPVTSDPRYHVALVERSVL
jgi:hypothetical protein